MMKTFAGDFASGASHVALVMFVVFFLLCELPVMGRQGTQAERRRGRPVRARRSHRASGAAVSGG